MFLLAEAAEVAKDCNPAIWFAVGGAIGAAAKWGFDLAIAKKSLEKMQVETIKTVTDVKLNLQKVRKDYDDKNNECTTACNGLLGAIRAHKANPTLDTTAEVAKLREQYLKLVLGEAVGRCIDLMELEYLDCYGDAIDIEQLLKQDLLPDLQTIKQRLEVANLPMLLSIVGRAPQTLQSRSFRRFRKLVRGVAPDKLSEYYTKVDAAIAAICG